MITDISMKLSYVNFTQQHSYGFIQCCDRQARLFFHFSQFNGNIEHLKIGDPVEFEMTYDRRTGKPIASAVTKIAPEVVLSEERVLGVVTTELAQPPDSQGRISYENRGECFFLPYCKDDVEGNVSLRSGDKVSFQIATNQRWVPCSIPPIST
jgi:cold shock CspA family protein